VDRARSLYRGALDAVIESGVAEDDVLAIAVFTTQDPVADLVTYRDWIHATLPVPSAETAAWRLAGRGGSYQVVEGRYDTVPVFQDGEIPYQNEGGVMEPGPDGVPVARAMITQRFALAVPLGAMPAGGYPIVLYAHGTGGDWHSFLDDGTAARLAEAGIASLGIDLIHHGQRNPSTASPDILFVNVVNPDAARDNIRQGALDFVQTARFVREATIPTTVAHRDGATIHFDPANVFFFGHSQGALLAPLYMGIDDGVRGGVVSAGGAVIGYALLEKTLPVSIPELLRLALALPGSTWQDAFAREGFGFAHPAVTMLQGWIDGADPASFGHLAFASPRAGFAPKSVLSTEGMDDEYAPPGSIEALAVAMRVPLVPPIVVRIPAYDVLGIGVADAPTSGNVAAGAATAGLLQYAGQGHFVVFDDASAQARIRGFFETMIASDVPTIPAP
jgi:alpha-beta hydrolase superfamily lysophospholipase